MGDILRWPTVKRTWGTGPKGPSQYLNADEKCVSMIEV
jgi:hypothetical protein